LKSKTKTQLSRTDIERIIAGIPSCDSDLHGVVELEDGYFCATYRIDFVDGRRVVLKVAPDNDAHLLRYERDLMSTEVAVIDRLRRDTGVPVPRVLHHDPSGKIITSPYFVMEFIDGTPLHRLRKDLPERSCRSIDRQVGRTVREINEVAGTDFGYIASCQPRFSTWPEAFDRMLHDVLADGEGAGVSLDVPYSEILSRCTAAYPALEEVQQPRLVHWDVWDANVFVDPDRLTVTGIIDFERTLWGDPLMEANFREYDPNGGFAEGYGHAMLATDSERVRRTLYDIHLYLIMTIECTYRAYPTGEQETWARERLAYTLDRLQLDPSDPAFITDRTAQG
jgi:aminoglycoside phosphotransferase (APT) family kinase protein